MIGLARRVPPAPHWVVGGGAQELGVIAAWQMADDAIIHRAEAHRGIRLERLSRCGPDSTTHGDKGEVPRIVPGNDDPLKLGLLASQEATRVFIGLVQNQEAIDHHAVYDVSHGHWAPLEVTQRPEAIVANTSTHVKHLHTGESCGDSDWGLDSQRPVGKRARCNR